MNVSLDKIRGVIGISLIWSLLWAGFMVILGTIIGFVDPRSMEPGEGPLHAGAIFAKVGLVSGILFGLLLALAERGKAILEVPRTRAVLWGIVGAAAFPLLTDRADQTVITCTMGALTVLLLFSLARRGERRHPGHSGPLDVISGYVATLVRGAVT